MEAGQNRFFDFILERTQEGKQDEMAKRLQASFKQQQEGAFDSAAFSESCKNIFSLLKPEGMDEVKAAMEHFRKTMNL